jgi:hypothetical protein
MKKCDLHLQQRVKTKIQLSLHLLVEADNIVLNVHHYNKEIAKDAHSVRYAIYEMLEKKIVPTVKSLKDKLISEQRIGFEFSVETLRKFLQVGNWVPLQDD